MDRAKWSDNLEPKPAYVATTLREPGKLRPEQMVGPIHVYPTGKFVYRGSGASGLIQTLGGPQRATLSTYRVGNNGRLKFVMVYNIEIHGITQW